MASNDNFVRVRTAEGGVLRLAKADLSAAVSVDEPPLSLFGSGEMAGPSFPSQTLTFNYSTVTDPLYGWWSATVVGGVNEITLNRDLHLHNMVVDDSLGPVTIKANGYKIFCTGTLTIDAGCIIQNNGFAAVGSTRGVISPAGTFSGGYAGTNGSTGTAGANSNTTSSISSNPWSITNYGGSGGAGGAATGAPGVGGGTAGGNASLGATIGTPRNLMQALLGGGGAQNNSTVDNSYWTPFRGGAGGSGGNGSGLGNVGGGGGGGGGIVGIYARVLLNNGQIQAKGGNGGAATGTNAGGGGGGGGGAIILVYEKGGSTVGTTVISGGTGGAGVGTGQAGANGQSGRVWNMGL